MQHPIGVDTIRELCHTLTCSLLKISQILSIIYECLFLKFEDDILQMAD